MTPEIIMMIAGAAVGGFIGAFLIIKQKVVVKAPIGTIVEGTGFATTDRVYYDDGALDKIRGCTFKVRFEITG